MGLVAHSSSQSLQRLLGRVGKTLPTRPFDILSDMAECMKADTESLRRLACLVPCFVMEAARSGRTKEFGEPVAPSHTGGSNCNGRG